jgi:hypothetical protein
LGERANQARARTTPIMPPWLAMPPSQMRRMARGSRDEIAPAVVEEVGAEAAAEDDAEDRATMRSAIFSGGQQRAAGAAYRRGARRRARKPAT